MLIIRVQEAWGTLILGFITVTVVLRVQSQACCSSLRASSVLVKSCLMARLVLSSFGPLVMCRSLTFCRCGETQGQAIMRVLHHFSCEWRVQEESSSNRLTVCCFVFSVIVPLLIRWGHSVQRAGGWTGLYSDTAFVPDHTTSEPKVFLMGKKKKCLRNYVSFASFSILRCLVMWYYSFRRKPSFLYQSRELANHWFQLQFTDSGSFDGVPLDGGGEDCKWAPVTMLSSASVWLWSVQVKVLSGTPIMYVHFFFLF